MLRKSGQKSKVKVTKSLVTRLLVKYVAAIGVGLHVDMAAYIFHLIVIYSPPSGAEYSD